MIKEYMKQTVEEAAISSQCEMGCQDCPNHAQAYDGYYSSKNVKCPFILGAEWQSKQSPWISVKERLPEEGQKVFVLVMYYGTPCIREEKFCRNSNLNRKGMWIHGNNIVMAWFPTPSFDDILEANRDVLEHFKTKEE